MGLIQGSPLASVTYSLEFTLLEISFSHALPFRESPGNTPLISGE